MKVHKVNDSHYTSYAQAFLNAGGKKKKIKTIEVIENDETFCVFGVETEDNIVKLVFEEQTFDVGFEYDAEPFPADPEVGIDVPGVDISLKNIVIDTPKGKVAIEDFYSILRKEDIQNIEDRCLEIAEEEVENDEPDPDEKRDWI